jgi:hypothetical protein
MVMCGWVVSWRLQMALYVVLNVNALAMLREGNLNKKCREIIYDNEDL